VTRTQTYALVMGTCIALIVLAWFVVRLFSLTAAIVMSLVASVLPPIAAILANVGDEGGGNPTWQERRRVPKRHEH
jgi:hypothetical protein